MKEFENKSLESLALKPIKLMVREKKWDLLIEATETEFVLQINGRYFDDLNEWDDIV